MITKLVGVGLLAIQLSACQQYDEYFRKLPAQPISEPSPGVTPNPSSTPTPSGTPSSQQFTVGTTQTVASVDLLLLIDNSGSMASKINDVKNRISMIANSPALQSANLRIAVQSFGESSYAYYKQGYSNNLDLYPHLFSAPGNLKYNTLSRVSPHTYYEIYPASNSTQPKRLFNPTTEMAGIQSALSSITTTNEAQSENGICSAALAYQSVAEGELANRIRQGDAFRISANEFHVVVVSDEENSMSHCPLQLNTPVRVPGSCGCVTQGVCTQTEPFQYSCPTDTDPNRMCTSTRCIAYNPPSSSTVSPTCPAQCTAPATPWNNQSYWNISQTQTQNSVTGFNTAIQAFKQAYSPTRRFKMSFLGYTGESGCVPAPANTFQSVGNNYKSMAALTGGISRCIDDDFGPAFQNIAQTISETNLVYALTHPAQVSSVTRTRSGATVTLTRNQDYWIENGNIRLASNSVAPGDQIRVNY